MIEIKFRLLDLRVKQMKEGLTIVELLNYSFILGKHYNLQREYIEQYGVFLQYTGLKDKNAKEIYEGDIISAKNEIYKIEYCADTKFASFMVVSAKGARSLFVDCPEEIEVIGNIYEDPELFND